MHRISGGDQKSVGSVLFSVITPSLGWSLLRSTARTPAVWEGSPASGFNARVSAVLCRFDWSVCTSIQSVLAREEVRVWSWFLHSV